MQNRLFAGLGGVSLLFTFSFFFPWLGVIPLVSFVTLLGLIAIDLLLLYRIQNGIFARRHSPDRLSNGDDNDFGIHTENFYPFSIHVGIIDEIPFQFQQRNIWFDVKLKPREIKVISYQLRPVKRGEYDFGRILLYVRSPIGLISRRYQFDDSEILPVYPSFLQMRRYELMAISNRLSETGIKKLRRLGHSMEFEHIRTYVSGDDQRSVNWKATARKGDLMINSYTDEKSQHVYCIVDKSRSMKMPFEGLSLLDYAINASLVLSNIALIKEDKAGLITISEKIGAIVPADRRPAQLNKILEVLYREKTRYLEINMELLYSTVRTTAKQRSLLLFFTNFESLSAMERQLPFLKRIAKFHLLFVIFFENTELQKLKEEPARNIEEIYIQTIAAKFAHEKKQIVKELARHGIQTILSTPQQLTVNTINKYLELKARQSF
ncbi:Uncharacterized conserved protein, DUF58 family, contains vWF domain [Daejeonella lutea]|uniref:Uncharacterized conserved protein, DUF58 family, contains vWF domain n=1 Tax=Daejeonella lutea TaxID=572036 RepID=A0A1T5BDK2_9SPHI|nr:Uncharacterized conserved protein, DUF58 family, contains vWF domain [Daejeonella lutea]